MKTALRVIGVGRLIDNDRALLVMFDRVPTDDEFREFHESMRARAVVKRPLGLAQEIAVSIEPAPFVPHRGVSAIEPIAINLAELRRVTSGWHARAVALGTDGVEDVLHAAEVAAKRGSLKLIGNAVDEVIDARSSDRPELLSRAAAKILLSDALEAFIRKRAAGVDHDPTALESCFQTLRAAGLLRCADE
jgi:hypothetical protein